MDSTPTSVRLSAKSYMRLLAVVQELERVQGRRMSMEYALSYVLDECEEQQAELEEDDERARIAAL